MTRGESDRPRVAILDDYQRVARSCADWSAVAASADITVFSDHIDDENALVERLEPFSVLCVMRERTSLTRSLLERLPRLRLVASTGPANAAIDTAAAEQLGIEIAHTGYVSTPTIELTWALILASQRHLAAEAASLRDGGWQSRLGREVSGRTLGLLGLGRVGSAVARIGLAFGMEVVAWSENLTSERASQAGVRAVSKGELFARADILSIHLRLSQRTRGLVDGQAISAMKETSWLVNTSRGPIVEEKAMISALEAKTLAGYAVDVFDAEPLPPDHPFRSMPNVLANPARRVRRGGPLPDVLRRLGTQHRSVAAIGKTVASVAAPIGANAPEVA